VTTTQGATRAERLRGGTLPGIAELCLLTVAGSLAFWGVTIACFLLPVVPEFRQAFSIASGDVVLLGSLIGGMVIGCLISAALLRFSSRIPGRNPLQKSVALSCAAFGLAAIGLWATSRGIEVNAGRAFLIGSLLNAPRFLALGAVIGALRTWLRRSSTATTQHESSLHLIGKAGR
jgi:hypothetical protein